MEGRAPIQASPNLGADAALITSPEYAAEQTSRANVPTNVGARTGYWNQQHDGLYIGVEAEGTASRRSW